MRKTKNFIARLKIVEDFKRTDKFLVLLILSLTGYGLIMIVSATRSFAGTTGATTQIAATIIGVVAMLIIARFDYAFLAKLWRIYLPLSYLLTLSLFIWGHQREGTDNINWIRIPLGGSFISIQPSEILKIAFILGFAYHISYLEDDINKPTNVLLLILHAMLPIFIINRQGDDGTMLVFIIIVAGMLFGSGLDIKYIIAFVVLAFIVIILIWFNIGPFGRFLAEYQRERIAILFSPGSDPQNIEYQQDKGLISMGIGGTFGIGLDAKKKFWVPEIENDFIFTYVGQVWGFVGLMVIIILMFLLCVRILIIGYSSRDKLGGMISIGVFSMIAAQSIINIGMCLKILPVIGITLPFFSKGGSSIVSILAAMGLVLSVHKNSKTTLFFSGRRQIRPFL